MHIVIYGAICYPAGRYGSASSICCRSPASMGAPDSSTAAKASTQSIRFRQTPQMLVHGDLAMGTRAAEAACRLPDFDGKDGRSAGRMVFLEAGGNFAG